MANFNINKSVIGGRLTSDAELKQTPSGVPVCSFTIAVARKAKRDESDFIRCIAWRNTAEFICGYFKKGSSICVTGSIQTRQWKDNGGNKQYATEVIVDEAYFVDSKSDSPKSGSNDTAPSYSSYSENSEEFETLADDGDLPF